MHIVLIKENEELGEFEFVDTYHGEKFMNILSIEKDLEPGNYYVIVEPIWNDCIWKDLLKFKSILIDIYAIEQVEI